MQTLLTIAGFDPSSGAGVTADLMVFAAHGFFGTSCITALTVQSTIGVKATYPVEAKVIAETLLCLNSDLPPAGIKLGMLGTRDAVAAVCEYLELMRGSSPEIPVVLDPVLRSSSGRELLDSRGVDLLRTRLLPLVDWVTPNCEEAEQLAALSLLDSDRDAGGEMLGVWCEAIQQQAARLGGRRLHVLGTRGGMMPPDDLLVLANGRHALIKGEHVETTSTHGTGCALSSALLCRLVLGDDPAVAAGEAKSYVAQALRRSAPLGHGHGPMNHLWKLR